VDVEIIPAGQEPEIDAAFDQISKAGLKALLVSSDPFFVSRREQLIALADRYAIPAFYQWREFVVAGGLMSYGASLADAYRQAGEYTGRILKGAKPSDLPVARPTRFELLINMNTAKALGIVIPPAILARAEIIE
jgi:putative ABC transport system substrate-binding protein